MFDKLKQLGDLKQMRDQAMAMQRQLAAKFYESITGRIKITIRGDQVIEKIEVDGVEDREMKEAVNRAIRKSQEMAARELSGQMGGLLG
jgi:hypothetical protein